MFFHVMLTTECNLRCKYCYAEALKDVASDFVNLQVEYNSPKKIGYRIESLDNFCRQDPECVLIFYGARA